jgi:PTS system nitrogen regulatory IIA component
MQLNVRDVSRILDVSERTVQRWVQADGLPASSVSGQYHFNPLELLEWATAHKKSVSLELFPDTVQSVAAAGCGNVLLDALRAGAVLYNVSGDNTEAVLRAIITGMKLPANFDRDFMVQLFLTREALGSTGVGDGLAIPHPRHPVVLPETSSAVTICFLEEPIDFNSFDKRPVDTLFVLISQSVRSHLNLLSRLASALRNSEYREVIRRRPPAEEILRATERLFPAAENATNRSAQ